MFAVPRTGRALVGGACGLEESNGQTRQVRASDFAACAAGQMKSSALLACIALAACGPRTMTAVVEPPKPTPHKVDTASPPQLRPTRELVFMGTTDVHNRLVPYDYYRREEIGYGLARLKPIVDSIRAANAGRSYLFDSGDILQGNPLGFVFARIRANEANPMIRAMNLLRYDASTVGNHEYNYGLANLDRALAEAQFPFVTANVFKHNSAEHAYRPYVLLPQVVNGGDTILIGITGNTPPGVALWDQSNVQGVLDFRDVVESVRPVVQEMKSKGADVVVVLSHGGVAGSSYDTTTIPPENNAGRLAREVPDIDVVFLGHTHVEIRDTTINGVLLTQAKNWAQSLAAVTLKLERRNAGDWIVISKSARLYKPDPLRADTAFLDSMRWQHERAVAYVRSVAGTSTERMEARDARIKDTPIIDFINEVQRKRAGTQLSAASAYDVRAAIPKGPITIADLAGLYIYDNTLKAVRISGAQLRAYLEKSAEYYGAEGRVPGYNLDIVSGVDYAIDAKQPIGQRIRKLEFRGKPVRDQQSFTLALNNYRQSGAGGYSMLASAPVIYDRQESIRELLISEVQARKVIRPTDYFRRNWTLNSSAGAPQDAGDAAALAAPPKPMSKKLRVVATNDVHGRLLSETHSWSNGRAVGGLATLAAYFKEEAAGFDGATVILDGGDVMQGTPISNLTRGKSTVATFNVAGYSGVAIGNHEFDWGVPILRRRIGEAKFSWLSANTFIKGSEAQPAWARPSALITVAGVKVGIIGLSTEATPTTTKAANVKDLEFRSGSATIDRWVPILRQRGADFVIVVAHSGAICDAQFRKCDGEIIDWAHSVTNKPDLIVSGHTHRVVRYVENGIPIVEAGSYTTRYAVVDLVKEGNQSKAWIRDFPTPFVDRVTPDTTITRMVEETRKQIGPQVVRVVATLRDTLKRGISEGVLGNMMADAFRTQAGAQLAFINNGSIRTSELAAGPVNWGALYSLQPFENRLVKLWMTGSQIRSIVETALAGRTPDMHVSGMTVTYNPSSAPQHRVERMTMLDGKELRDDETYVVVVTDFLAPGTGDGYEAFGKARRREELSLTDLDAIIKYLSGLPQPVTLNNGERRLLISPTN